MKKIKCEMCGGTDLIKENGVFVCENCGTKYSVEEAKKMMVEGVVEVKGKVKIDKNDSIENYLTMANNAYEAGNYQEAENYCNKIIEINLDHYEAWLLKGKAAGWQSTVGNKRFAEAINCFINAIKKAPENEKESIANDSIAEITKLSRALVSTVGDNFVNRTTTDNADSLLNNSNTAINSITDVMIACSSEKITVNIDDLKAEELNLLREISGAVDKAWNNVLIEFRGDDGRPNHYDYDRYLDGAIACFSLLEFVSGLTISTFKKEVKPEDVKKSILISKFAEDDSQIEEVKAKIIKSLKKTLENEELENFVAGSLIEVNGKESDTIQGKLEELGVSLDIQNVGPAVVIEDEDIKSFVIDTYHKIINIKTNYMNSCCWKKEYSNGSSYWTVDRQLTKEAKQKIADSIKEAHEKIHDLDPSYVVPTNIKPASNGSGVGCAIAIIVAIIIFYILMSS